MIIILVWCTSALAQANDPPRPEPLLLTDGQGEYPLGLHLEILEDPSGELTIDQVSSPEFDSQFIPSQVEVPNYGFTKSAIWVRLRLNNRTGHIADWLLEQGFANMQFIDLYTPLPDGEGFSLKQTGVMRPVTTRDIPFPRIIFNLMIPPGSQQTYYLRFQNSASMTLPLKLWTQAGFIAHSLDEQILMGIYYGIIIGLLLYNLFLLYSLREASYFYFVILLASLIFEEAVFDGYWDAYFLPNVEFLKESYHALSFAFLIASIVMFSNAFLEIKTRFPKVYRVNLIILGGWGVLVLLTPFTSYHFIASLMVPWALISLMAVIITGIASWIRGFRPGRFFMIAMLGMVASIFLVILIRLGLVSSNYFNENLYRMGVVWMAVCWSIALADRINILKARTESANRDLHHSEHRLSQILDGLPLGVVLYGKDQKPQYINRRTTEILSNPDKGIQPDLAAGRTVEDALGYYSMEVAGSHQEYPLENFPVVKALRGEPSAADDVEMDQGNRRVPLEIWASPVRDDVGNVESAVIAFQDITQRKQVEAELDQYRQHLEALVKDRTTALNTVNEQLRLRLEWLSAIVLVNQIMARSSDFPQIYDKIIEIINHLFGFTDSFIAELDESSQQMTILSHSCRSQNHPDLVGSYTPLPENILLDASQATAKLVFISQDQFKDLSEPISLHNQISQVQSISLIPLKIREKVLGFLGLEMHEGDRVIPGDEFDLLEIFSIDIAQLIEDSHLMEQAKAVITADERNRLARDLHDSVTQVLFSITLLAEVLPQIWRRDPEQGLQRLDKLRQLTRGALAEMRTMLLELRPSAVVNIPLAELLAQLTEAVVSRSGLPIQLYIDQIPPLPEPVHISFYRIAQEALNNVVKHAQANQVAVRLSATPLTPDPAGGARHEVKLVIRDDGVGFYSGDRKSSHLGIAIMHERAADIQANLSLESQPGYGTTVALLWCGEIGSQHD